MSVADIERKVKGYQKLDRQECNRFKVLIRDQLKACGCLPTGVRRTKLVNQTLLRFLGQRNFSTLDEKGYILNLNYSD